MKFPMLCLAVVLAQQPSQTPRKPSAIAPSLPALTEQEENQFDEIINRFIDYDSGRLRGPGAKEATAEFHKLGPEAIPALIRGLNRGAKIEHSCPAVTIAKKLATMLRRSNDGELLEFARENIGAGVTQSRHMGVLRDLRVVCMVRKRQVADMVQREINSAPVLKSDPSVNTFGTVSPGAESRSEAPAKDAKSMTVRELAQAVEREHGSALEKILKELGRRRGDAATNALASAASMYDGETRQQARDSLDRQLSGLSSNKLKEKLKDSQSEVRSAAARVAGKNNVHLENELISLLNDDNQTAREAAHQALVNLAGGADFGPKGNSSEAERREAVQLWRNWLTKQGKR
jgi:hypothetical protein